MNHWERQCSGSGEGTGGSEKPCSGLHVGASVVRRHHLQASGEVSSRAWPIRPHLWGEGP